MRREALAAFLTLALGPATLGPALAAAPLTEAFLAFDTPPHTSKPVVYEAGPQLFINTSGNLGLLFRFDPSTLAAVRVDDLEVWPIGQVGGKLLVEKVGSRQLLAVDSTSVVELPMTLPMPATTTADGVAFLTDRARGQKLWLTDGSAAGTQGLFDVDPNWEPFCIPSGDCWGDHPGYLTSVGQKIFFTAAEPGEAPNVFVFDREQSALHRITQISEPAWQVFDMTAVGSTSVAFLYARDLNGPGLGEPLTWFLWWSDGSTLRQLLEFEADELAYNRLLHAFGEDLLFAKPDFDTTANDSLWISRQGRQPPVKLADFRYLDDNTDQVWVVEDGHAYFPAGTVAAGIELWKTDGTAAGTQPVFDLQPGAAGSDPRHLYKLTDGRLVMSATDGAAGREVWISSGTAASTFLLADLEPGAGSSNPSHFHQHGQRLFFQAEKAGGSRDLYYVDLPAAPTCPADHFCLGDSGRFAVKVTGRTAAGDFVARRQAGQADSGILSFFSAGNWEMLVKVLDGCALNGHYWVFAAAATDVEYTLEVADTVGGGTYRQHHPAGAPAPALADTQAFVCN